MSKIISRCSWSLKDSDYMRYHDEEWGKHVDNEQTLFEFLILESAQAGLSWLTILKRREGYRKLFSNFDAKLVAQYSEADIDRMTLDPAIIRHRGKIAAAVENAKIFLQIQTQYNSFYNYLYSFMPDNKPKNNLFSNLSDVPTTSKESDAIAKDLKKRGFKFFGSTICYAYMQAIGMVNDHLTCCSFK